MISGISTALAESTAFKVYVCNVAEEPAQTEGYSVLDHLNVVRHYGGDGSVDAVVANGCMPKGPTPAGLDFIRANTPWNDEVPLVEADVIDVTDETTTARHDATKLSNALAEAYRKYRGRRRRLPRVRLNLENRSDGDRNTLNSTGLDESKTAERPVGRS